MERITTGVVGLDQILQGGLPQYSTVLVAGAPGTGKTILTQNMLFNNAKNANVLYITTLSEPQIKVIRYQQQFSFFDSNTFMERVVYQDIGSVIRREGINKALENIDRLVKQHQPILVAIDSLKAIADILTSYREFREFISDLNLKLALWGCTVLLLGEYSEEEIQKRPEAAIVDGIVYLCGTEERKHQKRYLRVLKMRGTDFAPGEHIMKITGDGVQIYPRLNPVVAEQFYDSEDRRQATGIAGLDQMIQGGLPVGTTTLVSGGTGTGKTLLGLNWLVQGAREKETGLFVTFEESPGQLIRSCRSFGWDLQDMVEQKLLHLLHTSPIELDVDEHVHDIQVLAKKLGVKRIVIDSITTFEIGMSDKIKYTDYLWGLADFFKTQGISLMLINESYNLFGTPQISRQGISYIADNIIFLQYLEHGLDIRRLIGVLKMRGSRHQTVIREYAIGDSGPVVLDRPVEWHKQSGHWLGQ